MILRARVLGEPANDAPFPHFPSSYLYKAKIIKNYSISFIFAFQEHQKCIFKASGEAKMQTSPPVPTMVASTRNTYVENKMLAPTFQKTCNGL